MTNSLTSVGSLTEQLEAFYLCLEKQPQWTERCGKACCFFKLLDLECCLSWKEVKLVKNTTGRINLSCTSPAHTNVLFKCCFREPLWTKPQLLRCICSTFSAEVCSSCSAAVTPRIITSGWFKFWCLTKNQLVRRRLRRSLKISPFFWVKTNAPILIVCQFKRAN